MCLGMFFEYFGIKVCIFLVWAGQCALPHICKSPLPGAKRGCHPCFLGKTAAAGTAEMAGLLLEIRCW